MALEVPAAGLRLAQIPRPADLSRKDKIAQSVVLDLSADGLEKVLDAIRHADGSELAACLGVGSKTVIELTSNTSDGQASKVEIPGSTVERSLLLSDNGFVFKTNDGAQASTLRSRINLRVPQKRSQEEPDEGMLALSRGISNTKAQKQAHRTTLAEPSLSSRNQRPSKFSRSLTAQLGNHRAGLFDRSKQRASLNNSPQHFGLEGSPRNQKKAAMEEARKRSLIHLLAVRPLPKAQIARSLRCALVDIEGLLKRFTQQSRGDSAKLELLDHAYKLLDPYGFNYPEEDRNLAIERAIEAFDRRRISTSDKVWQMLLPKSDRGKKNHHLSKLATKMLSTDEPRPAPTDAEARTTPVPEISVSGAGSPLTSDGELNRKRSSEAMGADAQERVAKRAKQAAEAREKRLLAPPAQRERERQKQREKQEKEALAAKRREAKEATQASPKAAPKKSAEAKTTSTASSTKVVKSSEFVTESDDEAEDTFVKKAQAAQQKAKAAAKPDTKPAPKTLTKSVATNLSAVKAARRPAEEKTAQKKAAPAPAAEKPSKPDLWDFASQKSTANSQPRPATTIKPATPRNVNLHHRKQLTTANTSARSAANSPLHRQASSTGVTAKPAARPTEKTATPRSEAARRADLARRAAGTDPTAARPANPRTSNGAARTDRPRNGTSRLERPAASSAARATAPGTSSGVPARKPDSVKSTAMQRTFSHQRKSSSPLKPSPLAASPPINFSDIDRAARGDKVADTAKVPAKRAAPATESKAAAPKPLKRKAEEAETRQEKTAAGSAAASRLERPAKRRETGTAASLSAGATASKSVPARHSDTSMLKARRTSQEGQKSHSPSPASSTIGSTSTKGTSMSLLSNSAGKERANGETGAGVAARKDGGTDAKKIEPSERQRSASVRGDKPAFRKDELIRASDFEDQRQEYNRIQKEVAAMENPPLEKVRELNKMFHSLETQKKVLSAIDQQHW